MTSAKSTCWDARELAGGKAGWVEVGPVGVLWPQDTESLGVSDSFENWPAPSGLAAPATCLCFQFSDFLFVLLAD